MITLPVVLIAVAVLLLLALLLGLVLQRRRATRATPPGPRTVAELVQQRADRVPTAAAAGSGASTVDEPAGVGAEPGVEGSADAGSAGTPSADTPSVDTGSADAGAPDTGSADAEPGEDGVEPADGEPADVEPAVEAGVPASDPEAAPVVAARAIAPLGDDVPWRRAAQMSGSDEPGPEPAEVGRVPALALLRRPPRPPQQADAPHPFLASGSRPAAAPVDARDTAVPVAAGPVDAGDAPAPTADRSVDVAEAEAPEVGRSVDVVEAPAAEAVRSVDVVDAAAPEAGRSVDVVEAPAAGAVRSLAAVDAPPPAPDDRADGGWVDAGSADGAQDVAAPPDTGAGPAPETVDAGAAADDAPADGRSVAATAVVGSVVGGSDAARPEDAADTIGAPTTVAAEAPAGARSDEIDVSVVEAGPDPSRVDLVPVDGGSPDVEPPVAATGEAGGSELEDFPSTDPDVLFDSRPAPEPGVTDPRPGAAAPPATGPPAARPTSEAGDVPAGAPTADVPIASPAEDAAPVADVPAADAPVTDVPATAAPVTDVPVTDVPVSDAPVADPPVTVVPVTGVPVATTPAPTRPGAAHTPAAAPVPPEPRVPSPEPPATGAGEPLRRVPRDPEHVAAEQAAADLALLRTFGDPAARPERAPIVALEGAARPEGPTPVGAAQPVRFRAVGRDGTEVAGAAVALLDDRGREAGAARASTGELTAPHPGAYVLVATAPDHQPGTVALAVGDAPVDTEVLLVRSAALVGVVTGEDGPLAGARVTLVQDGEVVEVAETDADGAYLVADLASGEYAVSVAAAGCEPDVVLVVVPDETERVHDVELEPAGVPAG